MVDKTIFSFSLEKQNYNCSVEKEEFNNKLN